ncbi:MAG: hypothetical protein Q8J78_03620 [Moraxellaceae bacterium]|nr:hypothetical protein [Moraxellaceae bacterium]
MTARSLFHVVTAASAISSTNRDQSTSVSGAGLTNGGTDYARHAYRAPAPFVWELFYARGTTSTGSDRKASFRLGGSVVAEAAPAGGAGEEAFDDTTTVSVVEGDAVGMSIDRSSTGSISSLVHRSVLTAPGVGAITPLVAVAAAGATAAQNTARAIPLSGTLAFTAAMKEEGGHVARFSGQWRGLYSYVASCSGAAGQIRAYKNGVATAMLLSIGIGESGLFHDNANVVDFVAGDVLILSEDGPSGSTMVCYSVGSSLISGDRKSELLGFGSRTLSVAAGTPVAVAVGGTDPGGGVTLADIQIVEGTTGFAARLSKMRHYVTNTSDQDVTATLYVNGSPTSLALVFPASTPVITKFETADGVYVDVGPNDRWAYVFSRAVPHTTGGIGTYRRDLMVEDITPPFTPKITFHG